MRKLATAALSAIVLLAASAGSAADDPSIGEPIRSQIQASMAAFIEAKTIDGVYSHYDPVTGERLRLELAELHAGIVQKGDFYVSCADFVAPEGNKVDLDFLVLPDEEGVRTVQAIVHKADGEKRPYHLESE